MTRVFIIAEAGVNHNGSLKLAKQLIDVAVEAKVDAVKFQTFKTELCISKNAQKADYQKQTTDTSESQFDMIKKLELDVDTHKELIAYCQEKDIMFLSTPFDYESIDLLSDLGLQIFKIPSGENCIINSKALIEHDCIIESHCHISTQAIINGGVAVGERSFVGSNSTTKQGIVIEKESFIKAGSVVK